MNKTNRWTHRAGAIALGIFGCLYVGVTPSLRADEATTLTNQATTQKTFATPDDAASALRSATESGDQSALAEIFGPDFHSLGTGDRTQDAQNARRFAEAMQAGCQQVSNEDNSITFEVGTNQWPMPIPLVEVNGQWHFDTAAGKEAIIDRHIGKDEFHAIGVCRAYVLAQKEHAAANPWRGYAFKFMSSPGTNDGLYWPATGSMAPSPFGPRVAVAQTGHYVNKTAQRPQPFHGYYFKILTCQGPDAPGGKMKYVHHKKMTGGFALLAYPEYWDHSGIMTFMVDQDGRVYQKDLGPETRRLVRKIEAYNPDATWTLVQDDGIMAAVMEP